MSERVMVGDREFLIVYGDEIYHVLNVDTNYETLFTGHYEECVEYCEKQDILSREMAVEV